MTLDVKLLYFFNKFAGKSQISDVLTIFFATYLKYILLIIFFILLYFAVYSKRDKLYIFWTTIISIIVARGVLTEIIRFLYHRPRPFIEFPVIKLIAKNNMEGSFPSGHSAFLFAMATAIYFYNKKWGIWFFVATILINISRIVAGVHYPSDILGGMVVGIFTGCIVFYFAKKIKND